MNASLTDVAGLIGDATRSDMLLALLAGQALTAGELAMVAGVSAQNASGHLKKLLEGGLLNTAAQGRHRYYRLATPEVAHALESLAAVSANGTFRRNESAQLAQIRLCRTCYDHLAGRVAVEIACSLLKRRFIQESGRTFAITRGGEKFFRDWQIDLNSLRSQRRISAGRCLDWTERRAHVSGALGAAILQKCKDVNWLVPVRESRAMRITARGLKELPKQFGFAPLK